ncbi:MAG: tetratricopeptide repeat protein [Vicinamibacterales bacterium]|mgnify:CR=1 FL=1
MEQTYAMEQSAAAPRAITIDEGMAIAMQCQKDGQLADAEALYRKVLEVTPDHPDALHYSGVLAHQQGRSDEAIALITRSLELAPNQPDWHSNLGIIFQDKGRFQEAVVAYRRALALRPDHANAHNNFGVLLRALGMNAEAEEAYRTAIRLNPNQPDPYHNLAILLGATNRTPEAVTCYCKALTLKPEYPEVRRLLALAYCVIGEPEKAVILCKEWLKLEPDDPFARHTLAAVSGLDVPARASDAYVQKAFDSFAASFEVKLAKLHYQAPALVAGRLADAGLPQARALDVLDAGCGTGLCGPLVAPYARRLVGVDLSEGMLTHAKEKNVYDELVRTELTAYLRDHHDAFDLIVSADTLVYFGALDDVAGAAAGALRSGGRLIFTVEEATEEDAPATYCIRPHGRYNHRAAYVARVLADAGLEADIARAELRMENGLPVAGLVVMATKPTTSTGATHA